MQLHVYEQKYAYFFSEQMQFPHKCEKTFKLHTHMQLHTYMQLHEKMAQVLTCSYMCNYTFARKDSIIFQLYTYAIARLYVYMQLHE
jgi:hypothetical protein